jgi:nucleoid-associated protein YgaU
MVRIGLAAAALFVAIGSLLGLHPALNTRSAETPAAVPAAEPGAVLTASVRVAPQEAPAPAVAPLAPVTGVELTSAALTAPAAEGTASRLKKLGAAKAPPDPTVDEVTDGVLVELGLKDAPPPSPEQAALRDMTANVLKGLGSVTGKTVTPEAAQDKGPSLQTLVAAALRDGKPDAYIDALVNEAAGRGEIRVPKALVTPEGKVDTAVLLAGLVQKATQATGAAAATPDAAGGEGVELRMVQKADGRVEQYQFYTVQPGDSLGAIAVKFYGDINRFMKVYEANRMILASPDLIRVGQRLVIPSA